MLTRTIVALVLTPLFVAVLTVLPVPVLVVVVAAILAMAAFELLRAVNVTKEQWCLYLLTMLAVSLSSSPSLSPVCSLSFILDIYLVGLNYSGITYHQTTQSSH